MRESSFTSLNQFIILVVSIGFLGVGAMTHGDKEEPKEMWTCSMHPDIRLPEEVKKCPICSMDLIPVDEGQEEIEQVDYLFGNHKCPVMGDRVDAESFVPYRDEENNVYGRIYMCCEGCEKKVEKNLEKLYTSLYRRDKETGEEIEPIDLGNDKCPMSGEPVIEGIDLEYNGMIVHFCCPGCAQDFLDNPDPLLAEIHPNAKEYKFDRSAGSGSSKKNDDHHEHDHENEEDQHDHGEHEHDEKDN